MGIIQESVRDVASIFAAICTGPKLSVTNFAAAMIMLRNCQEAQRDWIVKNQIDGIEQYLSNVPITESTRFLDLSNPQESHLYHELLYFIDYSLAIFGWALMVFEDLTQMCSLVPYFRPSNCAKGCARRREKKKKRQVDEKKNEQIDEADDEDYELPIIVNDTILSSILAATQDRLQNNFYDLIYINNEVDINVVPFLVAVDHAKQTLVVSIRGSMGMTDAIIDFNGQQDPIPIDDCPSDWTGHRGMIRSAEYIKKVIIERKIFEKAFNCRPDLGSQNYRILLCGHSLGAGVSAMLGILLYKMYPTLRAFLYSPPGGLLSPPVVEFTKTFATGIFLGNDCVPRLGVTQINRFHYSIYKALKENEGSKARLLASSMCPAFGCLKASKPREYDPETSSDYLLSKDETYSFQYKGKTIEPPTKKFNIMFVPGKLIHIVRNFSNSKRGKGDPIYQAIWADNYYYDRVVVDDGMLSDHLPPNLKRAMKLLESKTLPTASRRRKANITPDDGFSRSEFDISHQEKLQRAKQKTRDIEGIDTVDQNNNNNNNNNSDFVDMNYSYEQLDYEPRITYPDLNGNDTSTMDRNYHH